MNESNLTPEADKVLEKFISFWPIMTREYYRSKLLRSIKYEMLTKGESKASEKSVFSAIENEFPSFITLSLSIKDPQEIQQVIRAFKNRDEKNPLVKISRWQLPPVDIERPVKDLFALLASPRIGGNTDNILDAVLEGAEEAGCSVEKKCFSQLSIKPCSGCLYCQEKNRENLCSINDDMDYMYNRFRECDAFVLGFPIYSARESAQAATFIDRLKALSDPWDTRRPELKKGMLVATWGWPSVDLYRNIIDNVAFIIRHFGFEIAEVVTGCGFWESYYKKGSALLNKEGIEEAKAAGKALASNK
ncbi:flavodoxin family protein [Spirochaetota bacterium]